MRSDPEHHAGAVGPLWQPSAERIEGANITRFLKWLSDQGRKRANDYQSLWEWSTQDLDGFWCSIWDYFELGPRGHCAIGDERMPGSRWFPGTSTNYVSALFRSPRGLGPAIIYGSGPEALKEVGWSELERQVASVAAYLRSAGISPGKRVAAYLPNNLEAVVGFLAAASLGAIWSICSPDIGHRAVVDRFRQIDPSVIIAATSYDWEGRTVDRAEELSMILAALPSVTHAVVVGDRSKLVLTRSDIALGDWAVTANRNETLNPTPVPFEHPLWIVFSSGTTGLPKPIVHSHGGVLVEHLKFMSFHNDLGPDDRYFWYSSTGWIMWNLQVAGLLVGSTIVLYDGSATYPDLGVLWRVAAAAKVTMLGAGAAYFHKCMKENLRPRDQLDLGALRTVGSTGSPLNADGYRWVYEAVGDVFLGSSSGGTDIASGFVGGVPILPIYEGEMQARCLGAAVEAWDEAGRPIVGAVGELVCTRPMPSMPVSFWADTNDQRYLNTYFDLFPGTWRHGDWLEITPRGGAIIYGRSDATINRHGVRMGTSEIYRLVEALPEVADCLVVDLEYLGRRSFMPMFVQLQSGVALTADLKARIRDEVRTKLSARHVPSDVLQVAGIPKTLTGKKLEVPIKKLLLGVATAIDRDVVSNPEVLDWFESYSARLRRELAANSS